MTLRTRRKIFYTLVALFILVGGSVVFYAEGWRLDFATWHFEKVGGIYIRAYPENASLFLNGTPTQNQSGFLSPGTLISDLLPRTYSVTLKAPGYDDWQENAAVSPALVTQFKYAVLVPQDGAPAPSSTTRQIEATIADANASDTSTIDPYDQSQKIIIEKNEISLFNISTATSTQAAAISGKNISLQWISSSLIGILQDNGNLYLYDTNAQTLTKLADDVKTFSATNDGSMIATLERNSLEIFSLTDPSIYYRFNLPNIPDAQQVIWYRDETHLFVVYPDHVSFLDFADSNLINFTTVGEGTQPFYDPQTNALYMMPPSTMISADKLVEYDFPE